MSNPRGFYCPSCRGHRLSVTTVKRPCPGLVVRYRRCTACGAKLITEERVAKTRRPKAAKGSPA